MHLSVLSGNVRGPKKGDAISATLRTDFFYWDRRSPHILVVQCTRDGSDSILYNDFQGFMDTYHATMSSASVVFNVSSLLDVSKKNGCLI